MVKKYFPGANSGDGFVSRFSGIVPPWEAPHYTYVLKGGPGVGKNTLMRKVASRALESGCIVEEFRCASDPDSLDAVRIKDLNVVLLDGTAPHSIDPVLPGIDDEVIDLGHFKNKHDFALHREEVKKLFDDNKVHYRAAYACLSAAKKLKSEALAATSSVIDIVKLQRYLSSVIGCSKKGNARTLFARSATPIGVVDYSKTFLRDHTLWVSGIIGEVVLLEAGKLLCGRQHTVCCDFVVPALPCTVDTGEHAIAIEQNGDDMTSFLTSSVPHYALFCMSQVERLVTRATEELAKSLSAHDRIEEIYRPYVDYDRVNEEGEKLIKQLGI
ncbi:MAG: hypothetical protein IJA60_02415 [Clostridia bacterium]|nr:hypothetical protein [Clostridia bacterium]